MREKRTGRGGLPGESVCDGKGAHFKEKSAGTYFLQGATQGGNRGKEGRIRERKDVPESRGQGGTTRGGRTKRKNAAMGEEKRRGSPREGSGTTLETDSPNGKRENA